MERAGEGSIPADTKLGAQELAGSEGLNWKAVQYTSPAESHSAASVLYTRTDQAFGGTSSPCAYMTRLLQENPSCLPPYHSPRLLECFSLINYQTLPGNCDITPFKPPTPMQFTPSPTQQPLRA